jgi:glucose-6-phosphate isomerase
MNVTFRGRTITVTTPTTQAMQLVADWLQQRAA